MVPDMSGRVDSLIVLGIIPVHARFPGRSVDGYVGLASIPVAGGLSGVGGVIQARERPPAASGQPASSPYSASAQCAQASTPAR